MLAIRHVTRFRIDPLMSFGAAVMLAGYMSGLLSGIAGMLWMAPPLPAAPYEAPEVCELPPPADPIGFLILEDSRRAVPA